VVVVVGVVVLWCFVLFCFTGWDRAIPLNDDIPLLKLLLIDCVVLWKVFGPDNGALLSSDGQGTQIMNTPSLGL
jgi:hypothetical protein